MSALGHRGDGRSPVASRSEGPAWPVLVVGTCLLLGIAATLAYFGGHGAFSGVLFGPDSYTRGARALELIARMDWFGTDLAAVGKDGLEQHWTRPMDAIIAFWGGVASLFTGDLRAGVIWFATLWGPLVHVGLLCVLVWALRPILDRDRTIWLVLLLPLQFVLYPHFIAGNIDWHTVPLLHAAAAMGFALRLTAPRRPAFGLTMAAGLVSASGIWANGVATVTTSALVVAIGAAWVFAPHGARIAARARGFAAVCFGGLLLAFVLEHGLQAPTWRIDVISGLHLLLFGLHLLFWLGVSAVPAHWVRRSLPRLGLAILGAIVALAALWLLHPQVFRGAVNPDVDPVYWALRGSKIMEIRPLITIDGLLSAPAATLWSAWAGLSGVLLAVPVLVGLVLRAPWTRRALWIFVAAVQAYIWLDGVVPVKWGGLAAVTALPVLIELAAGLKARLDGRARNRLAFNLARSAGDEEGRVARFLRGDAGRRDLVSALLLVVFLLLPAISFVGVGTLKAHFAGEPNAASEIRETPQSVNLAHARRAGLVGGCDVARIAGALRRIPEGRLLSYADAGPAILFLTDHAVMSIPNHRLQPGFRASHQAMTSPDSAAGRERAREIIRDWGATGVLMCAAPSTGEFFGLEPGSGTLGRALLEGRGPGWLHPVELPDLPTTRGMRLFRVAP